MPTSLEAGQRTVLEKRQTNCFIVVEGSAFGLSDQLEILTAAAHQTRTTSISTGTRTPRADQK